MNLMIVRAKSLDIIGPIRSDFYYLTGLEMTYQVRLGWPSFFRYLLANAKKIERMHRIGCDRHTCADLSKFSSLLEYRNTVSEMLKCKRRAQTTNAAAHN